MRLILASQSSGRQAMLEAAGVTFDPVSPGVDERSAKAGLCADGVSARDLADALAELKAIKISAREPGALVMGCDSVVELGDGTMLDKAESRDEAAAQLRAMSGQRHRLHSAAVIAEGGRAVWRCVDTVAMHMRVLSDGFIRGYLDAEWEQVRWCVGAYRIEGPGAQLFSRIEGSHFSVIGLPLLPVLDYLRTRGALAS